MPQKWKARLGTLTGLAVVSVVALSGQRSYGPGRTWWDANNDDNFPREERYENADGWLGVVSLTPGMNTREHPFFEALGSNGRACITCHQPANAMSISATTVRERWTDTAGKDPIFAAVDGSNCPDLPQSEQRSHSLLLQRGVFRIALPWPPKVQPEFRIEVVRDPSGCNLSPAYGMSSAHPMISVFRRPRMVANLKFVTGDNSLMADGREPSLQAQATTAAMVHESADAAPRSEQLQKIMEFEQQVFVAQSADIRGGLLTDVGGPSGLGPVDVAAGKMLFLDAWRKPTTELNMGLQRQFRTSAARGSELYGRDCASCHSGVAKPMEIGTTNHTLAEASPDLPLFKITCDTGRVVYSQDPGRALITGKCADVGAIVVQQLRGLTARAPYFANGSATNLIDVVDFYNRRFSSGYSVQQKQDLVNFLRVL